MSENSVRAATPAERSRAWSDYWAGGALHSCGSSFASNYGGAIGRFWQSVFERLPIGARVLDLCCGNAPLSKLLLESVGFIERGGSIDAVDAAQIAPDWAQRLPATQRGCLRLHARTDAASLPFEAGSFDLVMSQFGVEYVGAPAIVEAQRVLRPAGELAAVLHHRQSLPVRIAREEHAHLRWLLDEVDLPGCAEAMLQPMALSATIEGRAHLAADASAQAARDRFNQGMRALQQRAAAAQWPDALHEAAESVAALMQLAREQGAAVAEDELKRLQLGWAAMDLRQAELIEFALDRGQVDALLDPERSGTLRVEAVNFDNGEIAGWAAVARPGQSASNVLPPGSLAR